MNELRNFRQRTRNPKHCSTPAVDFEQASLEIFRRHRERLGIQKPAQRVGCDDSATNSHID